MTIKLVKFNEMEYDAMDRKKYKKEEEEWNTITIDCLDFTFDKAEIF